MSGPKRPKAAAAKPVRLRPRAPCPICGKASVQRYHPFCSLACADVDLGRWLTGRYAVPAAEPGDGEEPEEAAGDGGGAGGSRNP